MTNRECLNAVDHEISEAKRIGNIELLTILSLTLRSEGGENAERNLSA